MFTFPDMKRMLNLKAIAFLCLLFAFAMPAFAQDPATPAYMPPYLQVKEALVKAQPQVAMAAAKRLGAALPKGETKNQALALAAESKLENQRSLFAKLTPGMLALLKEAETHPAYFLDHYPMAEKGKGADWISDKEAIENPYFGKSMLRCGQISATLP